MADAQTKITTLPLRTKHEIVAVDENMEAPQCFRLPQGEVVLYTARKPGEAKNEDAAAVIPVDKKRLILAVADGVGGHRGGDFASKSAVESLVHCFQNADAEDKLRSVVIDSFERANRTIIAQGIGAATTLVVAEIDNGIVRTYHAGDSAAMVIGGRGKAKYQTVGHSPVDLGIEAGLIDETDPENADMQHLVTNIVGSEEMRIELGAPVTLAQKDTLLLASDGLTDNFTFNEITEIIKSTDHLTAIKQLIEECKTRMLKDAGSKPGKPDDLTLLSFRV